MVRYCHSNGKYLIVIEGINKVPHKVDRLDRHQDLMITDMFCAPTTTIASLPVQRHIIIKNSDEVDDVNNGIDNSDADA